jgi:hypothetical protein
LFGVVPDLFAGACQAIHECTELLHVGFNDRIATGVRQRR